MVILAATSVEKPSTFANHKPQIGYFGAAALLPRAPTERCRCVEAQIVSELPGWRPWPESAISNLVVGALQKWGSLAAYEPRTTRAHGGANWRNCAKLRGGARARRDGARCSMTHCSASTDPKATNPISGVFYSSRRIH